MKAIRIPSLIKELLYFYLWDLNAETLYGHFVSTSEGGLRETLAFKWRLNCFLELSFFSFSSKYFIIHKNIPNNKTTKIFYFLTQNVLKFIFIYLHSLLTPIKHAQ